MRGTGKTTKQIEKAAKDAVFVWCNSHLGYPRDLAAKLGRTDLKIVSDRWVERRDNYRGQRFSEVVFDHAYEARNINQKEAYDAFLFYTRR